MSEDEENGPSLPGSAESSDLYNLTGLTWDGAVSK
jgi:hypothetical protein